MVQFWIKSEKRKSLYGPLSSTKKRYTSNRQKEIEKVSDTFLAIYPLIMVRFSKFKNSSTQQIALYKSSRPAY